MSRIRIIGGKLKGRKMAVLVADGLRPTSDRIRETLFNWLGQDLTGKVCLDLFAGSGVLGIESLSRGAKKVTFVENQPAVAAQLRKNLVAFNLANGEVCQSDAEAFLASTQERYDIIFCDPPFHQEQIDKYLYLIQQHLHEESVLYLETEKKLAIANEWQIIRQKETQQVSCRLLYLE